VPQNSIEGSLAIIQPAIEALVKRAIKSSDLSKDTDTKDLLRALISVSYVAFDASWQQSARKLVDILIAGSRVRK
jgi:hypothetical protein